MALRTQLASIRQNLGIRLIGKESYTSHLRNAAASITESRDSHEQLGYRRLSALSDKDLNPVAQEKLIKLMRWLYYSNPVMRRLTEIPVDYTYDTRLLASPGAHNKLQKVLDAFWNHPYNNLPDQWQGFVERLFLEGELLLPFELLPYTGQILLHFADPLDIKELEGLASDPRKVIRVKMKGQGHKDGPVYDVVNYQLASRRVKLGDASLGQREADVMGYRWGNAFYFRLNHLVTGRGRPPYEPSVDFIGAHDDVLFDQARNVALQGAFWNDVTLTGAHPADIEKRRAELETEGPPRSGSIRLHNEREVWEVKTPKLDTAVAEGLPVQLRKVLGLGAGVAETWVNASDDVNRATASVADTPPHRHLKRSQHTIANIARFIGDTVIDMAVLHGELPKSILDDADARGFDVEMSDLTTADNKLTAVALKSIADSLHSAMADDIIDIRSARTLYFRIAGVELPLDIDERVKLQRQITDEEPADDEPGNPDPDTP